MTGATLHKPHPPLLVWRYVLSALWKLILLTASVLVTVLAFAAAVKFMADGKLGPVDTIRFMGFAIPPMLEYAIPFAAGFGATLGYHRLASDNEVTACQAGGISYRSLLGPGLLTGMVLACIMLGLSNRIIPDLLRSMQELAYQDATRIMVSCIKRGEAVDLGGGRKFLAADLVEPRGPDDAVGAYQVLWLKGVLAVQLDKNYQVEWEGSADSAWVWFIREDAEKDSESADRPGTANAAGGAGVGGGGGAGGTTLVKIKFEQLVTHRTGEGKAEADAPNWDYRISTPLRDDPKFLSWRELREVRSKPEMMAPVNALRRDLATILAERATTERVNHALRTDGLARLTDPSGQSVVLRGAGLEWSYEKKWWKVLSAEGSGAGAGVEGPVRIDRGLPSGKEQRHVAKHAYLRSLPAADAAGREVTFEVRMEEVATTGASAEPTADRGAAGTVGPVAGTRHDLTLSGLAFTGSPAPDLLKLTCAELLKRGDERLAANSWDQDVQRPRDGLRARIARLLREVRSKEHERLAMAMACMVMVLTGSVMAMRLKESLPLVVYLWSFVPALACVMAILGGQQMMDHHGAIGIPILWSGVGGLGVFATVEYLKLRRH